MLAIASLSRGVGGVRPGIKFDCGQDRRSTPCNSGSIRPKTALTNINAGKSGIVLSNGESGCAEYGGGDTRTTVRERQPLGAPALQRCSSLYLTRNLSRVSCSTSPVPCNL